jgi:cell division protease FtsH
MEAAMNARKTVADTLGGHAHRVAAWEGEAEHDDALPEHHKAHRARAGLANLPRTQRVSTILAAAMLHEAMSAKDRRRLEGDETIAVVVGVPTPDWHEPVERAFRRIRNWEVVRRTGASRTNDRPDVGNDAVSEALSAGKSTLGISPAPDRYLPSALVSAADMRITLGEASSRVIGAAIRHVTGRRPGLVPDGIARGLTVSEISACIRRGSGATACVRRLTAASASKRADAGQGLDDVPLLKDTFGLGEAKDWGMRLVAAVEQYRRGERPWASIEDRNIVLSGDAGVGKTTFARILAKSADVPLIATSVSQWFASTGGYLNDICKAVDAVIAQAVAVGPAVLLLDEIDAVPNRATLDSRYREYWVPVVSHILLALDSAVSGSSSKLIVIGATNFPGRLDEALVRPGRLNRIVHIAKPDAPAIAGILRQHLGADLAGADLAPMAAIGTGATGAEVAGWARGARMTARAAGREMVVADVLDQIAPPETRSPGQLLAIARHEAAHSVATENLLVGSVTTVSLVSRRAYVAQMTARLREATFMGADELDALVVSVLAGRAADERWGGVTTGSAGGSGSDLAHATSLVAGKHGSWGLGETLLYRGDEAQARALLTIDPIFRRTVEDDLGRLYQVARAFVDANGAVIDRLAHRLVERRVLGGDEVRDLIGMPVRDGEAVAEMRNLYVSAEGGPATTTGGIHG